MAIEPLELANLQLDGLNPRHTPQEATRDIIAALLRDAPDKLLTITRDVAEWGLSPIDPLLVMPAGKKTYVTLEGNRRLAALKILDNPRLIDGMTNASGFRAVAASAKHKPTMIQCAVVRSREDADHWLTLRHTGENRGAGVVSWSAEQTQRFSGRAGSHAAAAVSFADAVTTAFSGRPDMINNLNKVRAERLTTLGRLIQDPDVRKALGIVLDKEGLRWHYATEALEPALRQLLSDLASTVTVSNIKSKEQRRAYIDGLPKPDPGLYIHHATALQPAVGSTKATKKKSSPPPSKHLMSGLALTKISDRTRAILREVQQLDVEKFPNACGVLLRVVVELTVDDFLTAKGIRLAQELKDKIRRALHELDRTDKDDKWAPVRAGLADGTSLMAAKTMHSFVHNSHYHPTPTELRSIASNYGPFVEALDSLLP